MNEKGLVVNMLALVESDYGKPAEGGKVICMSTWAQYILDNHATVAEAVADLRKEEFRVQTIVLPTGRPANMHLAISDATGDSAIFEYVNGKLVIHHGKEFKVLTNSPTYDQQLAIMEYWKMAGGLTKSLPGTSNAADRFVRASFLLGALPVETSKNYISGSPQQKFHFQAAMAVLSLMRSIGTPLGFSLDDQPWVSSTIWRTVSDSTNRIVLFDSAMTPATFWVKLDDLDFKPGAPVKKLDLTGGKTYSGDAADKFVEAKLFNFAVARHQVRGAEEVTRAHGGGSSVAGGRGHDARRGRHETHRTGHCRLDAGRFGGDRRGWVRAGTDAQGGRRRAGRAA